jgi:hypothetical protein
MHLRIVGPAIGLAAWAALGLGAPSPAAADDERSAPPPIFVAGRLVHEPALLERGHLLVPVRGVFEALRASVVYTPPRIVVVRKGETVLAGLVVDRKEAVVHNEKRRLAVAPVRRGNRVYVPLRFVAEIAGASVIYSSHPRLVDIRVPNDDIAAAPTRAPQTVVPPESGPPIWALGLTGMLVAAFAAELLRRLADSVRAKRTGVPR